MKKLEYGFFRNRGNIKIKYSDEPVSFQFSPVNLRPASSSLFRGPHDTWRPAIGSIFFKIKQKKLIIKNYQLEPEEEFTNGDALSPRELQETSLHLSEPTASGSLSL